MKTTIVACLILIMSSFSFAQDNCNCEQSLGRLIERVESAYPGFTEKTTDTMMYRDLKERLVLESQRRIDENCIDLLNHYLSYFRDPHIRLIYTGTPQEEQSEQTATLSATRVSITPDEFHKYITESGDSLEGVWASPYYKVGIIRADDEYQGFVIEASNAGWKAGEIKFRLMDNERANYYMGNHSLEEGPFKLYDDCILSFENVNAVFIKELPVPELTQDAIAQKLDRIQGFYFAKITDKTSILCISSFEDAYVARIEKIVSDNQQAIETCENLIIDIRNNLGGTYDAYDEILPYIHTGITRGVGQEFLVTQTLIDDVESWFDDEAGKAEARRWIRLFEGKIGEFVDTDTSGSHIGVPDIADHSPKQIVVLVNKRTASSGEAFTLEAKQSKKVKVLGTPTYGAIDYGSATAFTFGCQHYELMMPTWRSKRLPDYPIDNIGVQPDIYLDDSVEDWVQFAVDYLEN